MDDNSQKESPRQVVIGNPYLMDGVVTITIDEEGAEYIASVMERFQPSDAGAQGIARAIRRRGDSGR